MELKILHRHATALNLGDEALCEAIAARLGPRPVAIVDMVNEPHPHPRAAGWLPDRLKKARDFSRLLRALQDVDAVVCGGGDLILGYPTSYLMLRAARLLGVSVYMVGVGVNLRGSGWLARWWQRSELPRCARFWVRDGVSLQRLRELGVAAEKLVAVPDLVFGFERAALLREAVAEPDHAELAAQLPEEPYVAVSIREPEGNSARWGEPTYAALAEALDRLHERQGLAVVFVPMLSAARDALRRHSPRTHDDEQVARRVMGLMKCPDAARVLTGPFGFRQAFHAFAGARLTIGARLHSLIFSAVAHTPLVALSYNLKTESFMREAGLEGYALPIDRLTARELLDNAERALASESILRAGLTSLMRQRVSEAAAYDQLADCIVPRQAGGTLFGRPRAWCAWLLFRAVLALRRAG